MILSTVSRRPDGEQWVDLPSATGSLQLYTRTWEGPKRPFVLVHGLASNCRTWDGVAGHLAAAGHRVISLDQRGHGRSAKPDDGYDFATITQDLVLLLDALAVEDPILAGQSWGASVMLAFGARYPGRARGLALVDGGFVALQSRHNSWEGVAEFLRPPNLLGTPATQMRDRIRAFHPDWTDAGVESALANFEILPDQTVRPWLSLDRHMRILRALWELRPGDLFPQVTDPVLICIADNDRNPEWTAVRRQQAALAQAELRRVEVQWFAEADHDIHIQKPAELAHRFLEALTQGLWAEQEISHG